MDGGKSGFEGRVMRFPLIGTQARKRQSHDPARARMRRKKTGGRGKENDEYIVNMGTTD